MTHHSRVGLDRRICRLEGAAGLDLPAYIRRWLGETLSTEDDVAADAEWARVQARPVSLSSLGLDAQAWLREREAVA